ncbi:MAG: NAD(P)-binding protein [Myxococcales bacterium]|nr:NAD(P)-binding protein [Myxococcales bacterium]
MAGRALAPAAARGGRFDGRFDDDGDAGAGMKVAVVGAGIAGLAAAHYLGQAHEVVLYCDQPKLGGHTNTVVVQEGPRPIAIDTGFIVFNTSTYPNFMAFLRELGVAWAPSDMTLSVRSEARNFEYAGTSVASLFAQRRNLASPRFLRMLADLRRFYRLAPALVDAPAELTLAAWLAQHNFSAAFYEDHLEPLVRAVWSADAPAAAAFPARFMARFFANHGFLQVAGRSPWFTIAGGAHAYVRAMQAAFAGEVRLGAGVVAVTRLPSGKVEVATSIDVAAYDHVVMACHADMAVALAKAPTATERALLPQFRYQPNVAVLHTDAGVMPKRRVAWSSWNVHLDAAHVGGACLTYWMNKLQPLAASQDYFVSLNYEEHIDPAKVISRFEYAHPVFSEATVAAQARHGEVIDHEGISYCGAYWRNGFHEDGIWSALQVVRALEGGAARA